MPRERRDTRSEDYQGWVVALTGESFDVVERRLEERLDNEGTRRHLAGALEDLAKAVEERNEPLLYKAIVNFGSGALFGEGAQEVDLSRTIRFGEKDQNLLAAFDGVITAIVQDEGIGAIKERLEAIPEPLGSKCERGEFDGYNQEVLIVITTVSSFLKKIVLSDDTQRFRSCLPMMQQVSRSLRDSDRSEIFEGMRGIVNIVDDLRGQ